MDPRFNPLKIFCLTELDKPPQELIRDGSGCLFRHKMQGGVPNQMVFFTLGSWKVYEDGAVVTAIMETYVGDRVVLGQLSPENRSLTWEGKSYEKFDEICSKLEKARHQSVQLVLEVDGHLKESLPLFASPLSARNSRTVHAHCNEDNKNKFEPPSSVEVIMKPVSAKGDRKKRARMGGVDKTPEGSTPRKRKPPTRTRNIKDMFGSSENQENETQAQDTKGKISASKCKTDAAQDLVVMATNSVATFDKSEPCPSRRWGHTMCLVNESEGILIGGQGDKSAISKDSIWLLNLERRKWRVPDTSVAQGQKPEARMGHAAVYDPTVRSIYVHGGSKNLRWFSDVHMLDCDEWKWQCIKVNGKPPTRAYHSATLYRHELWIFGGIYPRPDPQPDGCSNDIHVFSPMEQSWYMPIVMGEKPTARSGHSATLLKDQLVMFGGWDYPVVFNDLHILDLGIVEWSQPKTNGTPPNPRSWHASCALSGNRMLIHGGYDGNVALNDSFIFNLDNLTWTSVRMEQEITPRCGQAALCVPYRHENNGNDEILVFGGGDNDGAFFSELLDFLIPTQSSSQLAIDNGKSSA